MSPEDAKQEVRVYIEKMAEMFEQIFLQSSEFETLRDEMEAKGFGLKNVTLIADVTKDEQEAPILKEPTALVQGNGEVREGVYTQNDRLLMKKGGITL